jgi:predicted secreted protein
MPPKRKEKAAPKPKEKVAARRRVNAKAAEPRQAAGAGEACPPEQSKVADKTESNLGHFETSRLLTALKYQVTSKKSSQSHKDAAQKLLEEYRGGDRKRKWNILESLTNRGFADLSWIHSRSESSARKETERSEVLSGMMTRAKILDLNGYKEQQMDESEAQELLEDLLQESESLYQHKRNCVVHRNPKLRRYFYKYNVGTMESEQFETEDRLEAYAESKGQKMIKSLEDGPEGPDSSSSPSFKTWTALTATLKKLKIQLQSVEDQVLLAEKNMQASTHQEVEQRKEALTGAKKLLQDALCELRMHLMESTTKHKRSDDCTESITERENLKKKVEDAKADCLAQIELSRKCWVS